MVEIRRLFLYGTYTIANGTLCNHNSDAGVDCIIGKCAELCTCVADDYE